MEGAFLSPKLLFQMFFQPRAPEPAPARSLTGACTPGTRQPWGLEGAGWGLLGTSGPTSPSTVPKGLPHPRDSQDLRGRAGGEP